MLPKPGTHMIPVPQPFGQSFWLGHPAKLAPRALAGTAAAADQFMGQQP